MIRFIKNMAFYLWFASAGLLLVDTLYSIFGSKKGVSIFDFKLHLRTLQEIGEDASKSGFESFRTFMEPLLTPAGWKFISQLPACVILLGLGAFFYILFRLICLITRRKPEEFTFRAAHLDKIRNNRGKI